MDAFQTILKFFMNRKTAIGYSFMALLTMGGERVFSLVAFRCPCSNENFRYGLVFLFSPALVLLVIGYFLNSKTWKLFTGCWVNPRKIFPRGNVCRFFYVFGQITLNALVAPVMWLSVALLNGTFYECAMSGLKNPAYLNAVCHSKSEKCFEELHKVACDKSSLPFSESDELKRTEMFFSVPDFRLVCDSYHSSPLPANHLLCQLPVQSQPPPADVLESVRGHREGATGADFPAVCHQAE
ncbi:calcium homeostasis modulator protein 5-like [Sylvia atricapilla]|uniref:calcium homeostasis modulator protein 5-like n=1 Tax=Sylvia atricapilla TaxID=48155 RepID=UPI003395B3AB